jgi:hypothetical protein
LTSVMTRTVCTALDQAVSNEQTKHKATKTKKNRGSDSNRLGGVVRADLVVAD